MWEITVLLSFVALVWFWFDSMRARERALSDAENSCIRSGLQFLDQTVECIYLRPARNEAGQVLLRRVYRFEFSDSADSRRLGHVTLLGAQVESLTMDPFLH